MKGIDVRSDARGFTLIELMIVVVIAAIMATLGLPSFRSFVEGQRIKTASGDFAQAALFARSEAIKRNAQVRVVSDPSGWVAGWTVRDAAGNVLTTQSAYAGLTFTASDDAAEVSYAGSGRLASAAMSLTVSGSASTSRRCVMFDLSGLPRTKQAGECP